MLGGGWVLLAGGLLAPLLAPKRVVLAASAAVAGALLLWANAPFTGIDDDALCAGGGAPLAPCLAAGVFALGVAAGRAGPRGRIAAASVLALALGVSLARDFDLGFPATPGLGTLALGAAAGVAIVVALTVTERVARLKWRPGLLSVVATVLAVGALLAVAAPGYVQRHAHGPLRPEARGVPPRPARLTRTATQPC